MFFSTSEYELPLRSTRLPDCCKISDAVAALLCRGVGARQTRRHSAFATGKLITRLAGLGLFNSRLKVIAHQLEHRGILERAVKRACTETMGIQNDITRIVESGFGEYCGRFYDFCRR